MAMNFKYLVIWGVILASLDYYRTFILILHACVAIICYDFQEIFSRICYSQTGEKEEKYISILSNSFFPYILNQLFLLFSTIFSENLERPLCICLILSAVISIFFRIRQYSCFCAEITEEKRKKFKLDKKKEDKK